MKRNISNHVNSLCQKYMNQYVLAELIDGTKIDGIITDVDTEYVYLAIPFFGREVESKSLPSINDENRQWGYGYYPSVYPYGYGYPPQRFRRLILPLAALVALSALPWY